MKHVIITKNEVKINTIEGNVNLVKTIKRALTFEFCNITKKQAIQNAKELSCDRSYVQFKLEGHIKNQYIVLDSKPFEVMYVR